VLFDRQITFLDQLASDIRGRTGATMSRAQIIRAFVDSIRDAGVDLTNATSEADLRSLVTARLRR
jgi:N-formylglutamate amidohydrolase